MRRLALVVCLVALTGCGTIRALAGPAPELVAAAPAINAALDRDSAANPTVKPANDAGKAALDGTVNPVIPPLPIPLPSPWGAIGSLVLAAAIPLVHSWWNKRSGDAAHAENAARLDEIEAKITPPAAPKS